MSEGPSSVTDAVFEALLDFGSLVDLPALPEAPAGRHGSPRIYERESYLVPDLPALESTSPDGRRHASVRDGEVVLRADGGEAVLPLTSGRPAGVGWEVDGQAADPWSPAGDRLFVLRIDRSDVLEVPRMLFRDADVTLDRPRQPKAGATIGEAVPHLLPLDGGEPLLLAVGRTRDCYFRLFGWRADGTEVWFGRYARDMSAIDILAADPRTGRCRVVLHEASSTFLGDVSTVIWGGPTGFDFLPAGAGFLWQSARGGWNRLYRHALDGTLVGALTPEKFVVHRVVRIESDAGTAFVLGAEDGERPYDVHLYRLALAGGTPVRLTHGAGVHSPRFEANGESFVDRWSSPASAPVVERRSSKDGALLATLGSTDTRRLEATGWRPPEPVVLRAADGRTALHGLLWRPHGAAGQRRYPLVEYVYGGPQMCAVPQQFMPRGEGESFLHALAAAGFGVFVVDGRGTPGRSKTFRDAVWRDFADHVVADHDAALRQLCDEHDWIDPERIGVFGRSWGGYFAFRFLAERPGLYRAGVAAVPGFDVRGGMLYEPYLGLPQVDDSAYRRADVFPLAESLRRPLLLVSGTLDTSTLGDAYRMSMALTAAGSPHLNVVFPEQDHVFTGAAQRQQHRMIRDFFRRELGG